MDKAKPTVVGHRHDIKIWKDRVLGIGAYGVVYEGKYEGYNVAVKRMDNYRLPDADKSNWEREIRINSSLNHPNIVKYHGHDIDEDHAYIVLEKCKFSLGDYLQRNEDPPMHICKSIIMMYQATSGLAYLHSKNILHRDLSTRNILLFEDVNGLQIKLTDFGISKTLATDQTSTSVTSKGTNIYLATEVINGLRVRRESDIFSLGVLFYKISAGLNKHPFGVDNTDIVYKIKHRKEIMHMEAHSEVRQLIKGMLEHESGRRCDAREVKRQLVLAFMGCEFMKRCLGLLEMVPPQDEKECEVAKSMLIAPFPEEPVRERSWERRVRQMASKIGIDTNVRRNVLADVTNSKRVATDTSSATNKKPKTSVKYSSKTEAIQDIQTYAEQGIRSERMPRGPYLTTLLGRIEREVHSGLFTEAMNHLREVVEDVKVAPNVPSATFFYEEAETCVGDGAHARANILSFISSGLYQEEEKISAEDACFKMGSCVTLMRNTTKSVADHWVGSSDGHISPKDIAKHFTVPLMCSIHEKVIGMTRVRPAKKAKERAFILQQISSSCLEVGDFTDALRYGQDGHAIMVQKFLNLASKYQRVGRLLLNMAVAHHKLGNDHEAKRFKDQAAAVVRTANDFHDEEQRQALKDTVQRACPEDRVLSDS